MLVFLLLFFFSLSPLTLSLSQDGLFLLAARRHLSDPENSLTSWNPASATPCRWRGITCHPITAAVTAVNLANFSLSGPIPAVLCRLYSLTSLNLSYNIINSTLSAASACRRLRILDLSKNALMGPIPDSLAGIASLRHLDLSANNLTGDIPSSLGALLHLESLNLVCNLLTGTIPSSLGNLTSLKHLKLAYNPFSPSHIPSQLGKLRNLETLFLAQCNLVGPIPDTLCNLPRLTSLDLSQNRISGHIPQCFTRLKSVKKIELYKNSLSGELPRGMSNMTSLRLFDASMNELTGTIPTGLCELPLVSLNLYENKLEGSLPGIIARSPNLFELKLFGNKLTGKLPSDLGATSPLNHIDVSFNLFSGEIPANICRWGQLEELILIYNSFSGEIPESLGNCKSLKRIRLRNNNLSGTVPDGVWGLPRMYLLEFLDNSLSGHISKTISGASNLSNLLLSNNKFSGSIPQEIGLLDNLVDFSASNNNFSGRIPESMMKLNQLVHVDLSCNQFSGELNFRGISESSKVTDLNLSHNWFHGKVPSELGKIPELNILDLSWNIFSGEIPKGLQNLKLSELNLSYNQLSGDIPPLYANKKYKLSFIGNPGLCGHPAGLCDCHGKASTIYLWILWSIFALAVVVFIVGVSWFYFRYMKVKKLKKRFSNSRWRSFHKLGFSEFEIAKLLSENSVIGSGASGKVYKVVLSNGEVVAVKKLCGAPMNGDDKSVGHRNDEFETEVETLGRIRHKNIVRLWCCYNSRDHRLLVYEYMQNGSLADLLKGSNKKGLLDWPTRHKIAVDTAEGLSYLHHDCVPPIVHRDVKSNNILVDEKFVAKVADFGVAKMITALSQGTLRTMSVIAGSYGYIAPEYAYTMRVNEKCDIYSFGVVILELVTGRPPIDPEYGENDLVRWVSSTLDNGGLEHVIDPTLDSKYRKEISKVLSIGLRCTSSLPLNRPTMRNVVKMLQEVTTVPKSRSVNHGNVPCSNEGSSHGI